MWFRNSGWDLRRTKGVYQLENQCLHHYLLFLTVVFSFVTILQCDIIFIMCHCVQNRLSGDSAVCYKTLVFLGFLAVISSLWSYNESLCALLSIYFDQTLSEIRERLNVVTVLTSFAKSLLVLVSTSIKFLSLD